MINTPEEPFYCFLSGGAGVGKSHVTKALYQAALKYYNTRPGIDFSQTKVLMLAPTGKAAYNIKGNTPYESSRSATALFQGKQTNSRLIHRLQRLFSVCADVVL